MLVTAQLDPRFTVERRRYERKRMEQPVTLQAPRSAAHLFTLRDLSLGGMYVETSSFAFDENTKVRVSFSLPHGEWRDAFDLEAVIVRSRPDGSGVMFVSMDPATILALSEALSRYRVAGAAQVNTLEARQ